MTLDCQPEIGETIPLADDEAKSLNSISTTKEYDATFIRILLEFLYKSDVRVLEYRSFTGRTAKKVQTNNASSSESGQFKAISPKKKNTIFSLFRERIEKCNISKSEKFTRMRSSNITRLVGIGIANIRKMNYPTVESSSSDSLLTDCSSHSKPSSV